MSMIKQSSAGTPITFFLVLASDHLTGAPGLSPAVTISKNGAAFSSPSGAVSDLGNGWYAVAGNATDTNTLGPIDLHASAATADPCDMKEAAIVVAFDPANSTSLGLADLDAAISSRMATFTLPTNFSALLITAGGAVTVGTNNDKTGYSLTQTFPANFSATSIDATGRIDVGKWLGSAPNALIAGRVDANAGVVGDKTGYSLSQAFPTNFSSLSIDVSGRVDLGKWIGVAPNALITGRVDSSVGVNNDKTGYSLSQTFPTNFSTLSIDASGRIDLGKWIGSIPNALISGRVDVNVGINSDKTGYTLSSAGIQAIWDFATSLLTTVGSIGKLLVTNLDTNIASRSTLDQAGVRTATGLASANLDTQFTAIPDAILDKANGVESGWTMRQLFRLWLAGICGPRSSFGTAAPTVSNPASTKTRLTGAGIDVNGNGTWSTDVT